MKGDETMLAITKKLKVAYGYRNAATVTPDRSDIEDLSIDDDDDDVGLH